MIEVDRSLTAADVRHAFGGALALAYHTLEPRATAAVDVNVIVDAVANRSELRPLGAHRLPFLAAQDLAVFKSLFDRPKDRVDIAAMRSAGGFDAEAVISAPRSLLGDDQRVDQLQRVVSSSR
jgi:hypothetical protein